jgi:hypothetical protein
VPATQPTTIKTTTVKNEKYNEERNTSFLVGHALKNSDLPAGHL